jgi:hypothetical protein
MPQGATTMLDQLLTAAAIVTVLLITMGAI